MRRGIQQVVRVVTAWMESNSESADADFAIQQLKQIEREGASGDLIVGFLVAVSSLLHDLAACTGTGEAQLLQDLSLRHQEP